MKFTTWCCDRPRKVHCLRRAEAKPPRVADCKRDGCNAAVHHLWYEVTG